MSFWKSKSGSVPAEEKEGEKKETEGALIVWKKDHFKTPTDFPHRYISEFLR
jgi:hypothetical protein